MIYPHLAHSFNHVLAPTPRPTPTSDLERGTVIYWKEKHLCIYDVDIFQCLLTSKSTFPPITYSVIRISKIQSGCGTFTLTSFLKMEIHTLIKATVPANLRLIK